MATRRIIYGGQECQTLTSGVILPKLTTTQRDALSNQEGMLIYNDTDKAVQLRSTSGWENATGTAVDVVSASGTLSKTTGLTIVDLPALGVANPGTINLNLPDGVLNDIKTIKLLNANSLTYVTVRASFNNVAGAGGIYVLHSRNRQMSFIYRTDGWSVLEADDRSSACEANLQSSVPTFAIQPTAGGVTTTAMVGSSVAINSNGTVIAVGCKNDASGKGCVLVFTRTPGSSTWTQFGTKLGSSIVWNTAAPLLGTSIAITASGDKILAGAPDETSSGGNTGAVVLFTHNGSDWSTIAPVVFRSNLLVGGSVPVGSSQFGKSVALDPTGSYAAVGGPLDNSSKGAVWIGTLASFTTAEKIVPSDIIGGTALFGSKVDMASPTDVVVSAPSDTVGKGAIWVLDRLPQDGIVTTGNKRATKLFEPRSTSVNQGTAVKISEDGLTVCWSATVSGTVPALGEVYMAVKRDNTWTLQMSVKNSQPSGNNSFGTEIALSGDGNVVCVSQPTTTNSAFVLHRMGDILNWITTVSSSAAGFVLTGNSSGNVGGSGALAMSKNGKYIVLGGSTANTNQGAIWVVSGANT